MEGYLFVAIGKKYIDESYNLSITMRKNNDERPISLLIKSEDEDYAKEKKIFDKLIFFEPTDQLYKDCTTSFEKFCLYPRINFEKYIPYEKTIITDTDMLCIHNMDQVWEICSKNSQPVQMLGINYDLNWHWNCIEEVIQAYGKHIPHTHGGLFYIKKNKSIEDFFSYSREVFYKYDEYKCKRFFRGGKVDEIIFAITFSKFGYKPIEFHEYPIMTFNLLGEVILPTKLQTVNGSYKIMDSPISLVHMFEKSEGINYQKLFKRIVNGD